MYSAGLLSFLELSVDVLSAASVPSFEIVFYGGSIRVVESAQPVCGAK
jgi:hypothetical protein